MVEGQEFLRFFYKWEISSFLFTNINDLDSVFKKFFTNEKIV